MNKNYSLKCFLFMTVTSFFLVACDGNTNNSEKKSTSNQQDVAMNNKKVIFENNNLTLLLENYLSLKNALVENNFDESKKWVSKIEELNTNEPQFKPLETAINKMMQASNVSALRSDLDTLSEEVYDLVKSAKPSSGTLYKQFCPMALNHQGASWLSTNKEIRNPYFGEKMLKCGVIKETI